MKRNKKLFAIICVFAMIASMLSCSNRVKNSERETVEDSLDSVSSAIADSVPIDFIAQEKAKKRETVDSALYYSWIANDDPILNKCAKNSSYLWHLVKIEAVDYSPISDSVREKLSKITMGLTAGFESGGESYKNSIVLNGCLRFVCEERKVETATFFETWKEESYYPKFKGSYSIFRKYFEKEYKKLGFDMSDSINTWYYTSAYDYVPNIEWVVYYNFNDYAFVGDKNHCCIVIDSKYILWFSKSLYLAPCYLTNKPDVTTDHFFEDPEAFCSSIGVDTIQKVICSLQSMDDDDIELGTVAKYYHIKDVKYNGYKSYLGEIPNGSYVKLLPKYKGYNLLITDSQYGDETGRYMKLYVYKKLDEINVNSSSIELFCMEEDPFENTGDFRHLNFKIYKDFTIRVDGKRRIKDQVDEVSRYYRINDNGQIYELKGK